MPPANTPSYGSPARPNDTPDDPAPMSYLSAPVPDFAASLFTGNTDEVNNAFLRNSLDSLSTAAQQSRSTIDRSRDPRLMSERRRAEPQRERLQRYLSHLHRIHHPPAPTAGAYSNRTPSPTRQSIYDWAPPGRHTLAPLETDGEGQHSGEMHEMARLQAEMQARHELQLPAMSLPSNGGEQPQPSVPGDRRGMHNGGSDSRQAQRATLFSNSGRTTARTLLAHQASPDQSRLQLREGLLNDGRPPEPQELGDDGWQREEDIIFRSALREEVRRTLPPLPGEQDVSSERRRERAHHDGLPPVTERMLRYFMDRERSGMSDEEERARGTGWYLAPRTDDPRHAFRREYLSPPRATRPSSSLENVVKYLAILRQTESYEDAFGSALDLDLVTKELYVSNQDGFLLELNDLGPIYETSWIQPGAVFSGDQYASTVILPPHRPELNATLARIAGNNSWPVRMDIHSVDYAKMSLTGTMEAYDVPRHPATLCDIRAGTVKKAGNKQSPIRTYVEGHIIDFRNHTFLTPSSKDHRQKLSIYPPASPAIDSSNWRRLPPFADLSDDEVVRTLLSKHRLARLNEEFVFMRWKERCFVHPKNDPCSDADRHTDHDRGHGLTISGFYYISLRRSNGDVEGLYFDPLSTPYQHLRLKGVGGTWPSLQFR